MSTSDGATNSKHLIEEMNRYYEARAPWHDEYMSYKSVAGMEHLMRPIIEILERAMTGRSVLEIACGTGNWTQVLATRAGSVIAVDVSPRALDIARVKLVDYQNVSFVEADAYDLRDVGNSSDVLFAADWWSHIPKATLPKFLASASRKLTPGSKAIFVDMSLGDYFRQESCYYDSDQNRISRRTLPDRSEFEVVKNFPTETELRHNVAGFADKIDYYDFPSLQRWMLIFEKR